MIRKILTWLPVGVAAVLVASAVPVEAKKPDQEPINGRIDLTLTLPGCTDGRFITWTGTVVIDGVTYGWADESTPYDVSQAPNEKFFYYEEIWTVFTLGVGDDPNTDGSLACDADVVMEGTNNGWGTPGGFFRADGEVTEADDEGPFANVADGSRMFWRGKALGPVAPGTQFKATLHITP